MNKEDKVWLNGNIIPFEKATVHTLSHGFSRGSAVFEVFGVHQSSDGVHTFRMNEHLKRLDNTCSSLGMELGFSSEEITAAVQQIVSVNNLKTGFVKLMAYYSEVSFANMVPDCKLDVNLFTMPAEDGYFENLPSPVSACISKWRKMHPLCAPPMAKACAHYLNGFLVRQDAYSRGYDIGVLLDTHGFVAEGSLESIFLVKNNTLITPNLGRVLGSVSRKSVIEVAKAIGVDVVEAAVLPAELEEADEIFFSSTPTKVLPVCRINEKECSSSRPITEKIASHFFDILSFKNNDFSHWFQKL